MNSFKISEAARQTGFSQSALRFYEQEGLVVPVRTKSGYRSYDTANLDSLRFVARAKRLGLGLKETNELLSLLAQDECQPVQSRLKNLIAAQIYQAQGRIADLVAFASQLQTVSARLNLHTPDGPCNDECGCKTDSNNSQTKAAVRLAGPTAHTVACTLDAGSVGNRIGDWQALVGLANERQLLANGVRILFDRHVDAAAMCTLAAAEQDCCSFFTFTISITSEAVTLDVTGPDEVRDVIAAMFGAAL